MKKIFIASNHINRSTHLFSIIDRIGPQPLVGFVSHISDADIVLVDSETIMPDALRTYDENLGIILYTHEIAPFLVLYTTRYDINGVISLSMNSSDMLKTITAAINNDIYYNEEMIGLLFSNQSNELAKKVAAITAREYEILTLMKNDLTNEEIAVRLHLSIRTVNAHKGNIMRKTGCQTTSGLMKCLCDYSPRFRIEW